MDDPLHGPDHEVLELLDRTLARHVLPFDRRSGSWSGFKHATPGRRQGRGRRAGGRAAGTRQQRRRRRSARTTASTRSVGHQGDAGAAEAAAGHPGAPPRRPGRPSRPRGRARGRRSRSRRASSGATRRRSGRPRPSRPRARAATVSVTRSISVTTWRARRRTRSSASASTASSVACAQRRHAERVGRPPRSRPGARRSPPSVSACATRVSVTSRVWPARSSGSATGAWSSASKSISSAAPVDAGSATVWSIPPVGAPTTSVSARMHASISVCRSQVGADRSQHRDADRALQRGRRRQPGAERHPAVHEEVHARHVDARPRAAPTATPAAYAAHPSTGPDRASSRRARPRARPARGWPMRTRSSSRGASGGVRRVGERHRQHQAAVVVGVLADQVHPARRPGDEDAARLAVAVREGATAPTRRARQGHPGRREALDRTLETRDRRLRARASSSTTACPPTT